MKIDPKFKFYPKESIKHVIYNTNQCINYLKIETDEIIR